MTPQEQWLAERQNSIGASEVASVLGLNPYQTPLQLYLLKSGLAPALEENEAMMWGHRLEQVVADAYAEETGRQLTNLGEYTIQRHADYPHMHATLDRKIMPCDGHDWPGVLQIKTTGSHMAGRWDDGIPIHIQVQIQAEIAVTKMDWGSVAVLIGGQKMLWMDIEKHDVFCDYMTAEVERFWGFIERGEAPPVSEFDTAKSLQQLHPEAVREKVIELDPVFVGIDREIVLTIESIKATESVVDRCKNLIRAAIGDAERGIVDGQISWSWKANKNDVRTLRRHEDGSSG